MRSLFHVPPSLVTTSTDAGDLRVAASRYLSELRIKTTSVDSMHTRACRLGVFVLAMRRLGVRRVVDLTASDLDGYLLSVRQRGLARATIAGIRTTLRTFGAWLTLHGLVMFDPAVDLPPYDDGRDEDLPPTPLSAEQMRRLLDAIPTVSASDLRNRAHAELLYAAGLRIGESAALKLNDVDWSRGVLVVLGKGGHQRQVPILPGSFAHLLAYRAVRQHLIFGIDEGFLFVGRGGGAVNTCTFREWLQRLGQRVLPPGTRVHPHGFRHACAVHLLRGGASIRSIQDLLGHADPETTMVYLRLSTDHLREAYDRAMPTLGGIPQGRWSKSA